MKFKLKGILAELSFPLVAGLCIVLTADKSYTAFCAVVNAVLHELGHIIVLRLYGCKIRFIRISVFDINIKRAECALSVNREIAVSLSGPMANLLFSGIFYLIYCFCGIKLFLTLSASALFLACFNLLPVESLDGGSAAMLFMLKRLDCKTALKILTVLSFIVLVPMAALGILLLLKSKYNFTLLFTSCYLIGIIILREKKNTKTCDGG